MTSGERDVHVEERASRILRDERAAAAHATFVEAQLRDRALRARLLAWLRGLGRILTLVAVGFLSAGSVSSPAVSPPPSPESAR